MNKNKKLSFIAFVILGFMFVGCGGDSSSSDDEQEKNKAPIVNAGNDKTDILNQPVIIIGTATDEDGIISSYEWKKGEDTLGTEISITYIPTKVGVDMLTFIATDDDGESTIDEVRITVKEENSDFAGTK